MSEASQRLMLRGLVSAAAANGTKIELAELDDVAHQLNSHQLDCTCAVCMAYVSAETHAAGLLAAMMVREK